MEAAGAPKLTVFLKTCSVPAGNTISALMFATFRQVKIQLTSLPEADRIRIVCCQIALGNRSNTFSGPTRSISCPWIVTANVFPPFVLIAPLRKYFLEQDFHGAFTIVVPDLKPRRFWWALLQSLAVDRALLGRKDEASILWYPSQDGQGWSLRNLWWGLWAFSCVC